MGLLAKQEMGFDCVGAMVTANIEEAKWHQEGDHHSISTYLSKNKHTAPLVSSVFFFLTNYIQHRFLWVYYNLHEKIYKFSIV